jgi:hypothetical protein
MLLEDVSKLLCEIGQILSSSVWNGIACIITALSFLIVLLNKPKDRLPRYQLVSDLKKSLQSSLKYEMAYENPSQSYR